MKTFIDGSTEISVPHGLPVQENSELYGIWVEAFRSIAFIVMASSEQDALDKFQANLEAIRVARGEYKTETTRSMRFLKENISDGDVKAIKLDQNRVYPVSYLDDCRSI